MRKQGWEKRLTDFLEAQRKLPFVWGQNDCVLFASKAANEVVDRDLTPEMLGYGEYDKARAIEILREHGGDISGIFDKHFKRKVKSMAQRGDIALVKHKDQKAAGVIVGRYVMCKTLDGMINVPMNDAIIVWGVE
jgi:hypothetical protein